MEHLKRAFLHVITFHPTKPTEYGGKLHGPSSYRSHCLVCFFLSQVHSTLEEEQISPQPTHPRSSPSWRVLGEAVTNQADFHLLEEGRGNGKDENLHLTSSWRVPLYISLLHRKNCVIWLACFCEKHIETLCVVGVYSRHRVLSHTPLVSTHVSFGDVLER